MKLFIIHFDLGLFFKVRNHGEQRRSRENKLLQVLSSKGDDNGDSDFVVIIHIC